MEVELFHADKQTDRHNEANILFFIILRKRLINREEYITRKTIIFEDWHLSKSYTKFISNIRTYSVYVSERIRQMFMRETISIYCDNHTQRLNKLHESKRNTRRCVSALSMKKNSTILNSLSEVTILRTFSTVVLKQRIKINN